MPNKADSASEVGRKTVVLTISWPLKINILLINSKLPAVLPKLKEVPHDPSRQFATCQFIFHKYVAGCLFPRLQKLQNQLRSSPLYHQKSGKLHRYPFLGGFPLAQVVGSFYLAMQ